MLTLLAVNSTFPVSISHIFNWFSLPPVPYLSNVRHCLKHAKFEPAFIFSDPIFLPFFIDLTTIIPFSAPT